MSYKHIATQILLATLLCQAIFPMDSAKILFISPYETKSQCILIQPFVEALNERGHDLTVIHAYPDCFQIQGVRYIRVSDHYNAFEGFESDSFAPAADRWTENKALRRFAVQVNLNVLVTPEVRNLMNSNETFDLIIMEPSNMEALFGFGELFNASLMGLSTCGSDWFIDTMVGGSASTTFKPVIPLDNEVGGFTIIDKFYKWIYMSEEWLLMNLIYLPKMREIHDQFYPHLSKSFDEIRQSFSLILLNHHFSLGYAQPNSPAQIEVGGMHVLKQVPELPSSLMEFIESAEHGVIYFALGVDVQCRDLSSSAMQIILEVFRALPQRIVWKYESSVIPNISSNIYISSWLPQQAILSHPNVKLFITHGGMLSVIETAHFGKPILGFPHFFDQFRNTMRLVEAGMGMQMELNTLTKVHFKKSIEQLVNHPKYMMNAKAFSQRFRDKPMHPLDTAVYWTEYVLRYKGAPHLRIPVSSIMFIDYYNVDKIIIVIGRLALIVAIVYFGLKILNAYFTSSCWTYQFFH